MFPKVSTSLAGEKSVVIPGWGVASGPKGDGYGVGTIGMGRNPDVVVASVKLQAGSQGGTMGDGRSVRRDVHGYGRGVGVGGREHDHAVTV